MNDRSSLYLKVLLNRFHKGSLDSALKVLDSEDAKKLTEITTNENEFKEALLNPEDVLDKIHYSWIVEYLNTLTDEERNVFLGALKEIHLEKTKTILGHNRDAPLNEGLLKKHLRLVFIKKIVPSNYTPLKYLPENRLSVLQDLSKDHLVEIINYLGLYDLAHEIKKMVDTKLLKKIYVALSQKKQEFLKTLLYKKEKMRVPSFDLSDWSGDKKDLELRIHKRGLVRLAKSLAGSHPFFVWHLTRKLDTGRGKILQSLIKKEEIPNITEIMKLQVQNILNYLEIPNQ